MDILIKALWLVKIIGFIFVGWKYGVRNFNEYSHDFDNNIESIFAFIAGSGVGLVETIKAHIGTDFSWLFFLMAQSFLAIVFKALVTSLITFYFTKFLKDPRKLFNFVKEKYNKWKS